MTIEEERVSFAGTMRITAELDLADALDFGAAVTHGAETLKALGSAEGLDARRAAAVGEMAGHQRSLDVAAGFETGLRPSSTSDAMLLVAGFETGLGPSSTSDVMLLVAGFETGLGPSSTSDVLPVVAGFETGLGPSSTSDVLPVVAGFEPGASATLARMGGEDDAMSVYDADWARLRRGTWSRCAGGGGPRARLGRAPVPDHHGSRRGAHGQGDVGPALVTEAPAVGDRAGVAAPRLPPGAPDPAAAVDTSVRWLAQGTTGRGYGPAPPTIAIMSFPDPEWRLLHPDTPCGTGVLVLAGSSGRVDVGRAEALRKGGARVLAIRWFGGPGQRAGPYNWPLSCSRRLSIG